MNTNSQSNCVFCKIVNNELPSTKVYEDDETVAFLNIKPVHPGHLLVIPKDHFENVYTVPAELWARMNLTAQKLSIALRQAIDADGINIHVNNEHPAGQEVFHSHIHIIPRHNDDGLLHWPGKDISSEEQTKVQEKIIEALR